MQRKLAVAAAVVSGLLSGCGSDTGNNQLSQNSGSGAGNINGNDSNGNNNLPKQEVPAVASKTTVELTEACKKLKFDTPYTNGENKLVTWKLSVYNTELLAKTTCDEVFGICTDLFVNPTSGAVCTGDAGTRTTSADCCAEFKFHLTCDGKPLATKEIEADKQCVAYLTKHADALTDATKTSEALALAKKSKCVEDTSKFKYGSLCSDVYFNSATQPALLSDDKNSDFRLGCKENADIVSDASSQKSVSRIINLKQIRMDKVCQENYEKNNAVFELLSPLKKTTCDMATNRCGGLRDKTGGADSRALLCSGELRLLANIDKDENCYKTGQSKGVATRVCDQGTCKGVAFVEKNGENVLCDDFNADGTLNHQCALDVTRKFASCNPSSVPVPRKPSDACQSLNTSDEAKGFSADASSGDEAKKKITCSEETNICQNIIPKSCPRGHQKCVYTCDGYVMVADPPHFHGYCKTLATHLGKAVSDATLCTKDFYCEGLYYGGDDVIVADGIGSVVNNCAEKRARVGCLREHVSIVSGTPCENRHKNQS